MGGIQGTTSYLQGEQPSRKQRCQRGHTSELALHSAGLPLHGVRFQVNSTANYTTWKVVHLLNAKVMLSSTFEKRKMFSESELLDIDQILTIAGLNMDANCLRMSGTVPNLQSPSRIVPKKCFGADLSCVFVMEVSPIQCWNISQHPSLL